MREEKRQRKDGEEERKSEKESLRKKERHTEGERERKKKRERGETDPNCNPSSRLEKLKEVQSSSFLEPTGRMRAPTV